MSSGAPWWAFLVTAGVALIAVCVSIYSLLRSDKREIEKWKRDHATKCAASIISKSLSRIDEFARERTRSNTEKFDTAVLRRLTQIEQEMRFELINLKICNLNSVHNAANDVYDVHLRHEFQLLLFNPEEHHRSSIAVIDIDSAKRFHEALVIELQKELNIKSG